MSEPRQIRIAISFKKGTDTYAFLVEYAERCHNGNVSQAVSACIEAFRATPAGRIIERKNKTVTTITTT